MTALTLKWTYQGSERCGICGVHAADYYDMTCGPLGDFRWHCAEHKEIVWAECHEEEKRRQLDYQERKEWHENYKEIPVSEA